MKSEVLLLGAVLLGGFYLLTRNDDEEAAHLAAGPLLAGPIPIPQQPDPRRADLPAGEIPVLQRIGGILSQVWARDLRGLGAAEIEALEGEHVEGELGVLPAVIPGQVADWRRRQRAARLARHRDRVLQRRRGRRRADITPMPMPMPLPM